MWGCGIFDEKIKIKNRGRKGKGRENVEVL